jgi:hypothetical protein
MEFEITLYIILLNPTPGVDFGLQKGAGSKYETVQTQRSIAQELSFKFSVKVKADRQKDEFPKFSGEFVQGPATNKFIYIDIGTCAGQTGSIWSRRLKIPLTGITWNEIDQLTDNPGSVLETRVPGTGRDGGPNCATVKPFEGWQLKFV